MRKILAEFGLRKTLKVKGQERMPLEKLTNGIKTNEIGDYNKSYVISKLMF